MTRRRSVAVSIGSELPVAAPVVAGAGSPQWLQKRAPGVSGVAHLEQGIADSIVTAPPGYRAAAEVSVRRKGVLTSIDPVDILRCTEYRSEAHLTEPLRARSVPREVVRRPSVR